MILGLILGRTWIRGLTLFFRLRRFKINLSFDGCSNRLNYGHPDLSTLNSHSTICQITVKSGNARKQSFNFAELPKILFFENHNCSENSKMILFEGVAIACFEII